VKVECRSSTAANQQSLRHFGLVSNQYADARPDRRASDSRSKPTITVPANTIEVTCSDFALASLRECRRSKG
jgi:hypothetical protein